MKHSEAYVHWHKKHQNVYTIKWHISLLIINTRTSSCGWMTIYIVNGEFKTCGGRERESSVQCGTPPSLEMEWWL